MLRRILFSPDAAAGGTATAATPGTATPAANGDDSLYNEIEGLDDDASTPKDGATPPKTDVDYHEREDKEGDKEADKEGDKGEVIDDQAAEEEAAKAKAKADADAKTKADAEAKAKGDKEPKRAKDLKVVYEETKAKAKELETKLAEATKQIETLKGGTPELKVISERLAQAEKQRDELQQKIAFADFTQDPKYVEDYVKPYQKAWQSALGDFAELEAQLPDGTTRPGSDADMLELVNLPLGEARRLARERFGDSADDAMAHRRVCRDLALRQQEALENAKKTAKSREEQTAAQRKLDAERYSRVWEEENKTLIEKFPKWFKAVDGDEKGNALLSCGYEEVDRFFNDQTMKPEERIAAHVRLRNKAANHDRMALRLNRARAKITKLEGELSSYVASKPPGGGRSASQPSGNGNGNGAFANVDAEIEALDDRS